MTGAVLRRKGRRRGGEEEGDGGELQGAPHAVGWPAGGLLRPPHRGKRSQGREGVRGV